MDNVEKFTINTAAVRTLGIGLAEFNRQVATAVGRTKKLGAVVDRAGGPTSARAA